jgi:large-conductance mechanosensitive channel
LNDCLPFARRTAAAGAPLLKYGAFISTLVDFLIVAWAIFIAVKAMNRVLTFGVKSRA